MRIELTGHDVDTLDDYDGPRELLVALSPSDRDPERVVLRVGREAAEVDAEELRRALDAVQPKRCEPPGGGE